MNASLIAAACHRIPWVSLHCDATGILETRTDCTVTLEGELAENQTGRRHTGAGGNQHMLDIGHRVD
jgi:hypothetical protein